MSISDEILTANGMADAPMPEPSPAPATQPAEEPAKHKESAEPPEGDTNKPTPDQKPVIDQVAEVPITTSPDAVQENTADEEAKELAILNKHLGKEFKTLEEAKESWSVPQVAADPQVVAAKKKEDAIKWSLNSDIIKPADLEAYHKDSGKTNREIAFSKFAAEQLAANKELTAQELTDRYAEANYEDADESDWRRQDALKREAIIAQQILNEKHGKVLNADKLYEENLALIKNANEYKSAVETAFKKIDKTFTHTFNDPSTKKDATVKFDLPEKTINAARDQFLTPEMYKALQTQAVTPEALETQIKNYAIIQELPNILTEMLKSYSSQRILEEKAIGSGVPPIPVSAGAAPAKDLSHGERLMAESGYIN